MYGPVFVIRHSIKKVYNPSKCKHNKNAYQTNQTASKKTMNEKFVQF